MLLFVWVAVTKGDIQFFAPELLQQVNVLLRCSGSFKHCLEQMQWKTASAWLYLQNISRVAYNMATAGARYKYWASVAGSKKLRKTSLMMSIGTIILMGAIVSL